MNHDKAEADLRWYYRDAAGEMGLSSNFGAMVSMLNGGGSRGKPRLDVDGRHLAAAGRAMKIEERLSWLTETQQRILRAAFGGEGLRNIPAVVPLLNSSRMAHLASGTNRPLGEWLARLGKGAALGDKARRRIWMQLRRTSELTLIDALSKFAGSQAT